METLAYWVARLEPLIRNEGEQEIIVVFANRSGVEDDAVYAGTSCVLGIQSGEVKLYGVLGRGEKELLVVDTSRRPQAKLVHDPATNVQMENSKTTNGTNGTSGTNGTDPLAANKRPKPRRGSSSTTATAGSTPVKRNFDDPEDPIGSIGEVLATATPLSLVEPKSNHAFFAAEPTKETELQPLKTTTDARQDVPAALQDLAGASVREPLSPGSPQRVPIKIPVERDFSGLKSSYETGNRPLKSATNGVPRRTTTPGPDDRPNGVYERPSSPKSRNASRNRGQQHHQEPALYSHDLVGMENDRNGLTSRSQSRQGVHRGMSPQISRNAVYYENKPRSADSVILPNGIEIVQDSDDEDAEDASLEPPGSPPRPRSTGW